MKDYFGVDDPAVVADLHLRTLDAIRTRAADRIDEVMDEHLAHLEGLEAEEQPSAG